jgi:hypothetical protein
MKRKIYTKQDIINLANWCLNKYVAEMGWAKPYQIIIKIQDIYEAVIYPLYELSLITNIDLGEHDNCKVLGKTISAEKTILIDKTISFPNKDARFTFTFGHEIGHGILHPYEKQLFRCTDYMINNPIDLLEMQANVFAEHLIMPHNLVIYRYKEHYNTNRVFRYVGVGDYCFNGRSCYICSPEHLACKLAEPLIPYFSYVSKESLGYTINHAGIIQNEAIGAYGRQNSCLKKNIRSINEVIRNVLPT